MDSAPYLQAEDKPDFERVLDELLHHDELRLALRRTPGGPNAQQLHTRALHDAGAIAADAASAYSYYRALRDQVRSTTPDDDPTRRQAPENPLDAAERAGWVPLIAVLLPILSGLGALVMLLLGYAFRADHFSLGQPLVTAGFVSAVVCAAAIAVDIIGLLLTAARDAAGPPPGRHPEQYAELATARELWHTALRDQALRPYLLAQLGAVPGAGAGTGEVAARPGVSLVRARPKLGYSSPGFTSPGPERLTDEQGQEVDADPAPEPHFSSPGFTSPGPERLTDQRGQEVDADPTPEPHFSSPGFTSPGPERLTDQRGQEVDADPTPEPHFSSPGYSRPDYSSPDFSSPAFTSASGVPGPRGADRPRARSRFLPNAEDADARGAADVDVDVERPAELD
ncbi:hypothetical protein GXW83_00360 [Streptacidiphilus sp. PB12-B1b]|uniref:hypothetical protein n=1 Tax=Streptacidiphilus sp. PB12-B1b TaxID=2705012 RepID=UPI0015FBF0ED|nr:hypothetical protein [Streptacidiphilus sp. PB12-B1b]QMU74470.1 hypothetical protein GXW83_00360 [Streptacidiphilus sp. PB12-B1b]